LSSHRTIATGLAGRYAIALFELASSAGSIEKTEAELSVLATLLVENEEFSQLVTNPIFGKDQQLSACALVAKTLSLSDLVANLLGVLVTNRRLVKLGSVIDMFKKIAAANRGEISAEVTTAHVLNDEQLASLKDSLKKAVGQDVTFETKVDESLLGGLIVKVGSRMIDSSLKSKLENLKVSMKGV
jgi:F-type H+-transporting ATPase subunit delta